MPLKKTVDEMILNLPQQERIIVERLRSLVHECLPSATEKGYYGEGVPFFTHHRMICFIWPSSVSWGPKRSGETVIDHRVTLGFCQGNLMSNEDQVLQAEGRKQVYVMYFYSIKDIKEAQVRALLFEAGMVDDSFGKRRKAITQKKSRSK